MLRRKNTLQYGHDYPARHRLLQPHPQHATAEKGETLFRAYSEGLVALLERVLKWDGVSWNG